MKNKIYTVNDWWGGPLCGVAEFMADKYIYQRRFDEENDMYTNDYFLTPITDEIFEKVMTDWSTWIDLYEQGNSDKYIRTSQNNINQIAEEQFLYQFCVKTGNFVINDNFNSYLENSWVEWSDSEYLFPQTFTGIMSDLYNQYYEDFTWMILLDNDRFFIDQLKREILPGHDLYGKIMVPTAKNEINNDVIFSSIEYETEIYYLIHFTYSNNTATGRPLYKKLGDLHRLKTYLISTINREYLD